MPNSRQTSVIDSPSSNFATNRKRSSITEHSFHGIDTSRSKAESVTYVSGTLCYLCLGPLNAVPRDSDPKLSVATWRIICYPGYNSVIPRDAVAIGEILRQRGYDTSWYGKDHNVPHCEGSQEGPFHNWPTGRVKGFAY